MLRTIRYTVLVCLFSAIGSYGADTASEDSLFSIALAPDRIEVGTFYDGAKIRVAADVPTCDGAVLVLEAGNDVAKLNRKGRVAGIWLNVAQVTVENVPRVYILAASDKLENICASDVQEQMRLGPGYLRKQIKFICDQPLTGTEFDEFLKLKTDNGTYKMDIGIGLTPAGDDRMALAAVLPIAATVPPGTYQVMLYCFKDGQTIGTGTARLSVERVGFARIMANLAQNHAAVYGIVAIAVAMMVGVIMGVIFSSLPGSGH